MKNFLTIFNGGSLGSCIDEERSEMRYVMWIADLRESSNLWTQIAVPANCRNHAWLSVTKQSPILVESMRVTAASLSGPFEYRLVHGCLIVRSKPWCGALPLQAINFIKWFVPSIWPWLSYHLHATNFWCLTSTQARLPAELKHINKRRKRN